MSYEVPESPQPVVVDSLPLPAGASTEATLAAAVSQLQSVVTQLAGVLGVVVSNFPSTYPLPSGQIVTLTPQTDALTNTQLRAAAVPTNDPGLPDTLGQKAMAASTSVAIASDQSGVPVSDGGGSITVDNTTSIDTLNSTSSNLGSGGVFTGGWSDLASFSMIAITIKGNVSSAASGFTLQWSRDGVTADIPLSVTYTAPNAATFYAQKRLRYFRIVYTNGAVAQSSFFIDVMRFPLSVTSPLLPIAAGLDDAFVAAVNRSVIAGKIQGGPNDGTYTNVRLNPQGHLAVGVTGESVGAANGGTAFPVGFYDAGALLALPQIRSAAPGTNDAGLLVRQVGSLAAVPTTLGQISTENSTTSNLAGGAAFTGSAWIDTLEWPMTTVAVYASHASATDGLQIQFSADGVTVHDSDVFTVQAANGQSYKVGSGWRYARIVYTNGATLTTTLFIQTILRKITQKSSTHRIRDAVNAEQDADLVEAIVKGTGTYGGQAGTGSATVNVPAGYWVRSYACQSGASAATITVPGVSGTITVPGSNQASTQFSDNPDPGTMIGPCTFTFSNTAAYAVIWSVI